MVTRHDYNHEMVEAARAVLVELIHLLGEYRDDMVLVGGWVPLFLCPEAESQHVGSMDIDLALDHRQVTEAAYRTIQQLLASRGYEQGKQPFIYYRTIPVGDREIRVEVDFLAGEYGGTGRGHRTQKVQDLRVRKARGADLAFDAPREILLEGTLPGGARDSVTLRIASVVPFIVMKSMALDSRLKEKDAWDIYYCLQNYPGGTDAVVDEFRPHVGEGLVREGLEKLAKHFSSVDSLGPTQVADFEDITDPEERDRVRRDAFERMNYLLTELGIVQ